MNSLLASFARSQLGRVTKLAASVLGFALVGCGAPIVPDLLIELSTTRRRQAPHESRAVIGAGTSPDDPALSAERSQTTHARDVSFRIGLALHQSPRRAYVDTSPAAPSVHVLPQAPACRSAALAAWERIAVEHAWLLVVLALGGAAESRAHAQASPSAPSSSRSRSRSDSPDAPLPNAHANTHANAEHTEDAERAADVPPHATAEAPATPAAPAAPATPATPATPAAHAATPDAHASPGVPLPPLEGEALARAIATLFAGEPDVLVVVRDALRVAGLDPMRARRHAGRGRRSGLVPEVRLGATRQRGVAATSGQTTNDITSRTGSDDSLRFEANLAFNLGYLVYGPDAVAWSREERAIVDAAASLAREIVELYFRRRRLIVELELLGERDPERQLALAEVDAMLEVFTAGNFSRMMRERPPP